MTMQTNSQNFLITFIMHSIIDRHTVTIQMGYAVVGSWADLLE